VYEVIYYTDSACTQNPITYQSQDGVILTTGVLDQCFNTQVGAEEFASYKSTRNGDSISTVFFRGSTNCAESGSGASEVLTIVSSLNSCNRISEVSGSFSHMFYTVQMAQHNLQELVGQVDLTQSARELNAQIVGASVGVLCGFTAILVTISMFGFLG